MLLSWCLTMQQEDPYQAVPWLRQCQLMSCFRGVRHLPTAEGQSTSPVFDEEVLTVGVRFAWQRQAQQEMWGPWIAYWKVSSQCSHQHPQRAGLLKRSTTGLLHPGSSHVCSEVVWTTKTEGSRTLEMDRKLRGPCKGINKQFLCESAWWSCAW